MPPGIELELLKTRCEKLSRDLDSMTKVKEAAEKQVEELRTQLQEVCGQLQEAPEAYRAKVFGEQK